MTPPVDDFSKRTPQLLPQHTRQMAIAAGIAAILALFGYGLPGLLVGSMPIVGAAVEPYIGRLGRWLLAAGALNLTIVAAAGAIGHALALRDPAFRDSNAILGTSLLTLSLVLIVWCDAALVIQIVKSRDSAALIERPYFRPLRWLVWLEALIGSALFFPEAVSECIQLSRHALGVSLGSALPLVVFPSLVLLAFDVALVAHAIRMRLI